jgi:RecB family exonuclease
LLPDGQVRVSPSRVQTFEECALRWLLSSRGGDTGGQSAARIGTLVHDIVAAHPDGDLELLTGALADRWSELALGDGWVADRERRRAETMLGRYVEYAAAIRSQGFTLVGTEIELAVPVGRALVTGRVDRLERDEDGHLRVVDLKTGSTKPLARDIGRHPQLGVYQVALAERSGSVRQEDSQPAPMPEVAEHGGRPGAAGPGRTAGAALVHLGRAAGPGPSVQQQPPLADDVDPRWAHDLVHRTAEGMAGAQFPATVGSWCRTCPVRFSCPLQPEGRSLR